MERTNERGVALVSALLVLMLMSAMLTGFMVMLNADQMAGGVNRDQTQAYAAAHGGVVFRVAFGKMKHHRERLFGNRR